MSDSVKVIAFDADDTLWANEPRFREAERRVGEVLKEYCTLEDMSRELYSVEVKNMEDYGFGAKAFVLSMLETGLNVSENKLRGEQVAQILEIGRELLHNPAEPLDGVETCLEYLKSLDRYKLVVLTKGDLLDQENKLKRSGLMQYFDYIEIVSDKTEAEYGKLCKTLGIGIEEFAMVGNSFKSDIAPVLRMGGYGVYIPFHVTWELEKVEEYGHPNLVKIKDISEVISLFK